MTDLSRPSRPKFELDTAMLDRLLAFIAPSADKGEAYRRARQRVESFFRWRGLSDPGRLADETLDRVARRLGEGEVFTNSPNAFLLGVARMVALEARRKDERRAPLVDVPAPESLDAERERRLEALERCLDALPTGERELLLSYHQDDRRARIDGRQALAARLGLAISTLRVRAFRIRERVERCVEARLGSETDSAPSTQRSR